MKIQTPLVNTVPLAEGGLRVERVTHYYGTTCALRSVSLEAAKGEVCAILGPNGAGKTTLMRLITGYFLPLDGHIWLGPHELTKNPLQAKHFLGYLPEYFPLYPHLTVREFLMWCLSLRRFKGKKKEEVVRVLKLVDLLDRINSRISKLSRGMRQRLGLAQALLGDPAYLILDEPSSGLDPAQIRGMRELIAGIKQDRTIILSTHILAEAAQISDRIVILSEGQVIASGRPRELESAYLHGESIYRIGIRGDIRRIEEVLPSLPYTVSFEMVSSMVDHHRFELRVQPDISSEMILEALGRAGLVPFEYYRKELKLEDIFFKAVTEEAAP